MKDIKKTAYGYSIGIICGLIILVIILLSQEAHSQSLSFGLGYTSDGRTTAKAAFATGHKVGAYICYYAEDNGNLYSNLTQCTGFLYHEKRAIMFGITYQVHEQVTVYAGAGSWNTSEAYNTDKHNRYWKKTKGHCLEAGATMLIATTGRFGWSLDASLNSTGQVNTMLICTIKLPQ